MGERVVSSLDLGTDGAFLSQASLTKVPLFSELSSRSSTSPAPVTNEGVFFLRKHVGVQSLSAQRHLWLQVLRETHLPRSF